jgi:hypothetical protein
MSDEAEKPDAQPAADDDPWVPFPSRPRLRGGDSPLTPPETPEEPGDSGADRQ